MIKHKFKKIALGILATSSLIVPLTFGAISAQNKMINNKSKSFNLYNQDEFDSNLSILKTNKEQNAQEEKIEFNKFVSNELNGYKTKGIELLNSFKISGEKWVNLVLGYLVDIRTDNASVQFEDVSIPVVYEINDENVSVNIIQNQMPKQISFDPKTGEGITNGTKIPFGLEGIIYWWVDKLPRANIPVYPIFYQNKYNSNTKITNMNNFYNILQPMSKNIFSSDTPSYAGAISSAAQALVPYPVYVTVSNGNSNLKIEDNDFWKQIIMHFKKQEVINYFNFAFKPLDREDRCSLEKGPKISEDSSPEAFREWNYSDLVNGKMPALINWNPFIKNLIDLENICNLITLLEKWMNNVESGSGWIARINSFIKLINNYKFSSYDEIKGIYDKYYEICQNNPSDDVSKNEFENLITEMNNNPKLNYKTEIDKLDAELRKFSINKPNIILNQKLGEDFAVVNENNIKYQPYKLLSYYLKGVLNANNLYADVEVTSPNGNRNKKEIMIYNSISNEINNGYLGDVLVESNTESGGILENVSLRNFKVKNTKKARFLNIDSTEADYSKFNNLQNQLQNIKIKYNSSALDYDSFLFESWMKNQNAIGLDINKYLSEIINLRQGDELKQTWDFIGNNEKQMILNVVNGTYNYLNNDNELINVSLPVWLHSSRPDFANDKRKAFSGIESIAKNNIDRMINENLFNLDEWSDAWKTWNIDLDNVDNKYPLIQPKQELGEFWAVLTINAFHKSSNYKIVRNNMINTKKPPIVLINKDATDTDGTGYFLVKFKSCFNQDFKFNINDKRRYKVQQFYNPNESIDRNLNNFIDNVVKGKDENGVLKYWMNDIEHINNNGFFNGESWDKWNWKLDKKKIWYDIFSDDSFINYDVRQRIIKKIKSELNEQLSNYVQEKFGKESEEYKVFVYYLNNFDNYQQFYDAVSDDSTKINYIPFVFSNKLWNNLDKYKKYIELKNNISICENMINYHSSFPEGTEIPTQNELDKLKKELEKDAFYVYLKNNESNQAEFSNFQIEKMFSQVRNIQEKIINDGVQENNGDLDLLKNQLKNEFMQFKTNWNTAIEGKYQAGSILIDGKKVTFNKWLVLIKERLDKINVAIKYKEEINEIFIRKYDPFLNELINVMEFKIGNEINSGLIFTSVEEMVNDPLVKMLVKNYNLNIDDVFLKTNYQVNGCDVNDAYDYHLNQEIELPFNIQDVNINGVNYYSLTNYGNNLKINVSLETLKNLMMIYSENNKGQKTYKVINIYGTSEGVVGDSNSDLKGAMTDIKTIQEKVNTDQTRKYNYKKWINVWAILIVTLLPIAIISTLILFFFLKKAKKSKTEF